MNGFFTWCRINILLIVSTGDWVLVVVVLVDFNTVVPFELEGGTTVGKSSELVACSCLEEY